jgi:nucleoside-diphosphate-sugar epimerase
LVQKLVASGNSVWGLVRHGEQAKALRALGAEPVLGDVTEPQSLERALFLATFDVVFHLAGIRRAADPEVFFQVNAEGTRHVCNAMVKASAKRLVLCGSLAASGPSTPERPKCEDDSFEPIEWYGHSKAEAERIAYLYNDRLEVTVARPCRIMGPGDKENLVFFKIVAKGYQLTLGGGPRPLSLVDVEDVAEFLLVLADRREAVGESFFVGFERPSSFEEVERWVASALAVTPRNVTVPPMLLQVLAAGAEWASKLTGRNLPLNRKLARQLLAPAWTCSTEKAQRLLGFRAKQSIEASIRSSAEWYRRHGWI